MAPTQPTQIVLPPLPPPDPKFIQDMIKMQLETQQEQQKLELAKTKKELYLSRREQEKVQDNIESEEI